MKKHLQKRKEFRIQNNYFFSLLNSKFCILSPAFCIILISVFCILHSPSHSQNINIGFASSLSYGTQELSNIWGWVHPITGKEYALVGAADGLSIVDVTNPAAPFQIVEIPPQDTNSLNCIWREVKTWGNYAYITTECGQTGLQIIDLTNLPSPVLATVNWKPVIGTDTLKRIHALHIDNGKLYLYGGNLQGCVVADVSTTPMNPIYLGSYNTGGYIHDGYVQGDTMYAGHIWAGTVGIVDMSNPANGVLLASFQTPNFFTHNTWLSSDSKICFTTDEKDGAFLTAFDISNLGNIFETDRIKSNPADSTMVHNTYIINKSGIDYAVTSWYKDGITIVDAARPHNLVQVGNYDTSPLSGKGYGGCWGVYPYFPSGTIVASDIELGLFVLTPTYTRACYLEGKVTDCSNGNPILGVNVTIQIINPTSNANEDVTDANGDYAVGVAAPGTYQVVFSKTGFISDTDIVVMSAGVVNIHNVQVCPTGIYESSMQAEVKVYPNPFSTSATLAVNSPLLKGAKGVVHFVLYDIYGREIRTPNSELNTPCLSAATSRAEFISSR